MFFRKNDQRRTHPYATITVGTLAMIGAFHVVRCVKRGARCVRNKVGVILRGPEDSFGEVD